MNAIDHGHLDNEYQKQIEADRAYTDNDSSYGSVATHNPCGPANLLKNKP